MSTAEIVWLRPQPILAFAEGQDIQDMINNAVAANPGCVPFEVAGLEVRGQCVSCGHWNVGNERGSKTKSGKVYCGECYVPDEGELLINYGNTRTGGVAARAELRKVSQENLAQLRGEPTAV